jgi:hypothetical protein
MRLAQCRQYFDTGEFLGVKVSTCESFAPTKQGPGFLGGRGVSGTPFAHNSIITYVAIPSWSASAARWRRYTATDAVAGLASRFPRP